LRAVLRGNHKSWDVYLSQIEFAYNKVVHMMNSLTCEEEEEASYVQQNGTDASLKALVTTV